MSHISNVKRLYIRYRNTERAKKTQKSKIMTFAQWKRFQIELINKKVLQELIKPKEKNEPIIDQNKK